MAPRYIIFLSGYCGTVCKCRDIVDMIASLGTVKNFCKVIDISPDSSNLPDDLQIILSLYIYDEHKQSATKHIEGITPTMGFLSKMASASAKKNPILDPRAESSRELNFDLNESYAPIKLTDDDPNAYKLTRDAQQAQLMIDNIWNKSRIKTPDADNKGLKKDSPSNSKKIERYRTDDMQHQFMPRNDNPDFLKPLNSKGGGKKSSQEDLEARMAMIEAEREQDVPNVITREGG